MKWYVKETVKKDADGEELQVVEVHPSMINDFNYLVFLEK